MIFLIPKYKVDNFIRGGRSQITGKKGFVAFNSQNMGRVQGYIQISKVKWVTFDKFVCFDLCNSV